MLQTIKITFKFHGKESMLGVMHLKEYSLLLQRLGLAGLLLVISRLGFYFYNLDYFSPFDWPSLLFAFVYGFRFDLATLLICNLIFILISLIPYRANWINSFLKFLFVSFNTLFLSVNIVDLEFFVFLGRKMTMDIFGMAMDIQSQSFQLIYHYWFLSLLVILSAFILWRFYPEKAWGGNRKVHPVSALGISFVLFLATAIGVRGGVQLRSIGPKDAFIHESYELGNLTVNSAYTMVRSIGEERMPKTKFFASDEAAAQVIKQQRNFQAGTTGIAAGSNVVIIIMESLSQEYVDAGLAPNFSKLAQRGLYFPKNFANGRRSIEALPSIMTGFPSLLPTPIYQSQFQANRFYALPELLKQQGYKRVFFHGGKRGTMDFDSYCYSIGFEQYFAKEDYPDQNHFDGHWGIYDHYFFDFFANHLQNLQTPFLAGFFSLSSHQPYSIPAEFNGKYSKGELEIHQSIGYADEALERFIQKASNAPWFQNTLFIITADHTSKLSTQKFNNVLGRYRVPLLFFHPRIDLSKYASDRVTQHADILPSVMDFLGLPIKQQLLFGSSVFGSDQGSMINLASGQYLMVKGDKMLRFDREKSKFFALDEQRMPQNELHQGDQLEQMLQLMKAYIQYSNNGLRNNNIYQLGN